MPRRAVVVVLIVWLIVAVVVSATGVLLHLPAPPPAIAVALTILLLLAIRISPAVRSAAQSLGVAPLVAFHLVRIAAGAWFLVLNARGDLPDAFALAAGWGDIAVGLGAIAVLAFCVPVRTGGQRIALLAWNIFGLIDILGVLGNGARLFLANPSIGQPFMTLPLALLPTFVVPLVIVSHVLLFGVKTRRP